MYVMPPVFNAGDTIYFFFDTYNSSGASVTITGLAVTDIEVYKNGSVTQRSSDSGYALLDTDGIDFDGTTGLHGFSIDTSDNTDAGFWADGAQYLVNVNAITVDSQTVSFSYMLTLGYLLRPTTAGRKLDVSSGGEAGVDWANVGSPTTTVGLSGTTVKTATDVETDTADIQSRLPAALGANGNIKADIRDYNGTAGTFASGRPEVNTTHIDGITGAGGGATDWYTWFNTMGNSIGTMLAYDISWDGIIIGLPALLENGPSAILLRGNTCQAGSTSTTCVLDGSASATTDFYKGLAIAPVAGTGAGQAPRLVTAYNGTTKTATVTPAWATTPDGTTEFALVPANMNLSSINGDATAATNLYRAASGVIIGTAATGTLSTTTMTTNLTISSTTQYQGKTITWVSGTLAGESREISSVSTTAGQLTWILALPSAPSNGDVFVLT